MTHFESITGSRASGMPTSEEANGRLISVTCRLEWPAVAGPSATIWLRLRMKEPLIDGIPLPEPANKILKDILKVAGLPGATVTSAHRTPAEQARVMYENCMSKGAAYNEALYCTAGDRVVEVFAANHDQPRDAVIRLMTEKILEKPAAANGTSQ